MSRLLDIQIDNDCAGLEMQREAGRFAALASRHIDNTAPRAIAAFNLFQTPEDIAEKMAAMVNKHTKAGGTILEPSAGLGRLYLPLREQCPDSKIILVENAPDCVRELYDMTEDDEDTTLKQCDFLSVEPFKFADAVCMNPPFKMGMDIKHIMHAFEMLKSGGLLVSLCYNGVRQNKKLKPLCDTWEVLPEGSFRATGTSASVAMLTMTKAA